MTRTIKILLLTLFTAWAFCSEAAEIAAIRASDHKDYHRLVIILSEEIPFKITKEKDKLSLKMREMKTSALKTLPSTNLIKVTGLEAGSDLEGRFSLLKVAMPEGSEVRQTIHDGPYRVILDIYPPKDALLKAVAAASPAEQKKTTMDRAAASAFVAFNDSWRWVYRKKALEALKSDLYSQSGLEPFNAAGINAENPQSLENKVQELILRIKAEGQPAKAEVLKEIYRFYSTSDNAHGLEAALRANPESGFSRLGYLVLGANFEKNGFFPEASGYFKLASSGPEQDKLKSLAIFRKARVFFLQNKYAEAKDGFKKAAEAGYPEAEAWLANTCLVRGELDLAWDIYKKSRKSAEELDPVTRLSLADINLAKGNYHEARYLYSGLGARYPKHVFITPFLKIKEADVSMAEGNFTEAEPLYTKAREGLSGEPWAMATLALADSYSAMGDKASLAKAEKLYATVADGKYIGTDAAAVRLVDARIRLGSFREGLAFINAFNSKYPANTARQDLNRLSSVLFYEWINALYAAGDYFGTIKIYTETPMGVPFGKKAETSLKIAKAYIALGLNSEAVGVLDSTIKLGNNSYAEEAMLLLAGVYLDQKDADSAERLIDAFKARFPKSLRKTEIEGLQARVYGLKGGKPDTSIPSGVKPSATAKNRQVNGAGKSKDAASFEKAAAAYGANGESAKAAEAYVRSADLNFESGDFNRAAEGYSKALAVSDPGKEDKQWALYRLAQCYSRLNRKDDEAKALKDLKAMGGEFAPWSEKIFRKAPSL